jgi:hypothetical protein
MQFSSTQVENETKQGPLEPKASNSPSGFYRSDKIVIG